MDFATLSRASRALLERLLPRLQRRLGRALARQWLRWVKDAGIHEAGEPGRPAYQLPGWWCLAD